MLPLVYTPTVGEGCQRFSEICRRPRGLFLSYPNKRPHPRNPGQSALRQDAGDRGQRRRAHPRPRRPGRGRHGHPDRQARRSTRRAPASIRARRCRCCSTSARTTRSGSPIRSISAGGTSGCAAPEYDEFVEAFVSAVAERWPNVLLQWEDFASANARRLLERYRDRLCTFNDDIQGTAAVAAGSADGGDQRHRRDRSPSSASCCSARARLDAASARCCCKAMTRCGAERRGGARGFLRGRPPRLAGGGHERHPRGATAVRAIAAAGGQIGRSRSQTASACSTWWRNAKPTVLIGGVGPAPARFTEPIVREMARHVERPIIFPLSNPTSRSGSDAAAAARMDRGRAIVSTGSPFPAGELER